MPNLNRRDVVDPEVDGIYMVTSRCVRQMFLMRNKRGKKAIERRKYVLKRIKELAANFGISIGFHSILENHLHLMLANLPSVVQTWSDGEVLRRVCRIFPSKFKRLGVKDSTPSEEQIALFAADVDFMKEMRVRLSDPSWFMRQLMQSVARKFNAEDKVKGHFVDRRFHCKPVTDEEGVHLGGMYIDLNEMRAELASTLEESKFSSVGARIAGRQLREAGHHAAAAELDGFLRPIHFDGDDAFEHSEGQRATDRGMFDMTLDQYLSMLDYAGRVPREGKRGTLSPDLAPILERLRFNLDGLAELVGDFDGVFRSCVGGSSSMSLYASRHNRHADDIIRVKQLEDKAAEEAADDRARTRREGACRRRRRKK